MTKESRIVNGLEMVVDTTNKLHIIALTKDLVRLAILSNRVITQGSFKGSISDEVSEVLTICKAISKEYIVE